MCIIHAETQIKTLQERPMEGFVIQNANGGYLTHKMFWFYYNDSSEAYVHYEDDLGHIRRKSASWEIQPATRTRAVYNPETGTTLIGKPVAF